MALDEPKDTDSSFKVDGFTYLVDRAFLKKVQPVKGDFINYGFKISAGVEFDGGGCSGCKSSGSCG
jgi:hypothetical protein